MRLRTLDVGPLGSGPWASPNRPPPATLPSSCDVVVVGAGITGLSAALALAERDVSVLVVDRDFGHGATSRSGGIVLGDTLEGPALGFHGCERILGDWIVRQALVCGFRWTTCLELAHDGALPTTPIDWHDHGPVRVAMPVAAAIVDPVRLLNGLLWTCLRAGVSVVSGAEVASLIATDSMPVLTVGGACVSARQAIMATDAITWRNTSDPWTERTLTVALQTDALPPNVLSAVGLQAHQPFYTRDLPLLWGRPLLDGSCIFGRELVAFPWDTPRPEVEALVEAAAIRLIARVRTLHPRLANVDVRRFWAGATARTPQGLPLVVADDTLPGVFWAGGYGGHGLAQAFTIGRRAATHVMQQLHAPR